MISAPVYPDRFPGTVSAASAAPPQVPIRQRFVVAAPERGDPMGYLRVIDTQGGRLVYRSVRPEAVRDVAAYLNAPDAPPHGETLWAPAEYMGDGLADTGYRVGDRVVSEFFRGRARRGVVIGAGCQVEGRRCKGCRTFWQQLLVAEAGGAFRYWSTQRLRRADAVEMAAA